jgi:uncharacterized repeat protein (TIGR03803 family)
LHSPIALLIGLAFAILAGGSRAAHGAATFEVPKSFELPGANPRAALVVGIDGALYGTTTQGGASDAGTVFRIDGAGSFTSLHSFDGRDDRYPEAALVVGSDGSR